MSIETRLEALALGMGRKFAELRERVNESVASALKDLQLVQFRMSADLETAIAGIRNGEPGAKGETGAQGEPGERGITGEPGLPGERGERGLPGEPGEKGERGEQGISGQDGKDGEKGEAGEPGEKGEKGDAGEPGERGDRGEPGPRGSFDEPVAWTEGVHYEGKLVFLDGSTFFCRRDTAARPPHADWAPVALRGLDGTCGEARGLYDADVTYSKLDHVSHNGCEWIAVCDAPGPLPGDDWKMGAQRGLRGKPGEKGERGDRGPIGVGIASIGLDPERYTAAIATTDGKLLELNLRPLFERYDQERGA